MKRDMDLIRDIILALEADRNLMGVCFIGDGPAIFLTKKAFPKMRSPTDFAS